MTQTLDKILTPDSLQQAMKNFADQMALESSPTADPTRTALMELEEYCKDGSTVWVELAASFLGQQFQPDRNINANKEHRRTQTGGEKTERNPCRLRNRLIRPSRPWYPL